MIAIRAHVAVTPGSADAPEQFAVVCALENTGVDAVQINRASLSSPSLALEVVDADGAPVLLPPPPVPSALPPMEILDGGARLKAAFPGFLPGWTRPGRYRVRCRYVAGPGMAIVSDWAAFELR